MKNYNILIVGAGGSLGQPLCMKLKELGHNCITPTSSELNLKLKSSIESYIEKLPSLYGAIFLAGKEPSQNLKELEWNHLGDMISIHFRGVLWCIKLLQQKLIENSFITTTSSVASSKGSYDPSYSSMKSAVEGLTKTLVRDLSPNTRINSVAPGLVLGSKVYEGMTKDFIDNHLNTTPLNRLAHSEDIVEAYLFLIKNKHITGQVINVNGGQYTG
jgi:3-oxoacyl-[acyl-carrier protein] reductase